MEIPCAMVSGKLSKINGILNRLKYATYTILAIICPTH